MTSSNEKPSTNARFGSRRISGERLFLLGSILLAFLIRYFFIPYENVINGDGVYYTILGERFVSGDFAGGISAYWSPLYSVLTGFSTLLFAEREFAGRFVSLVAGSLLIIPAYFLISDFFGRRSAYVGSILLIFHPFLIKSSGWVMTEAVYTLILITCVLTGWYALSKRSLWFFLLTGLLIGTAFLTKPEAIGYLLLMLGFTLAARFFGGGVSFTRSGLHSLTLLLGFMLLFLPYCLHLHNKTGEWTLSQKIAINFPAADYAGELLALTRNGRMTMKDRIWGDDYETDYQPEIQAVGLSHDSVASEGLRSDAYILGSKAFIQLKKQLRDYFPAILPIPFAILALVGFFSGRWTRARMAKEIYLFSFVICTLLGYAASAIELRYLFPVIPLLIAYAAYGVVEFSDWLTRALKSIFPTRRDLRPNFIMVCILTLAAGWSTPLFFRVLESGDSTTIPFEEKRAGLWISERSNQVQPTIISSHITAAFYAKGKHLYLPDEELSRVVEYARFRRADYLIFSERRGDTAPFSTEKSESLSGLDLVYADRHIAGYRILVYQLPLLPRKAESLGKPLSRIATKYPQLRGTSSPVRETIVGIQYKYAR